MRTSKVAKGGFRETCESLMRINQVLFWAFSMRITSKEAPLNRFRPNLHISIIIIHSSSHRLKISFVTIGLKTPTFDKFSEKLGS